jgi:hypothetical protein
VGVEICDGKDNNCNGQIDENFNKRTFYRDSDADGYGNIAFTVLACTAPAGYVANAKDCNDMKAAINPAAVEVCDGKDNNCNGLIDEGATGGPLVQACYTGPDGTLGIGICKGGTQTCARGAWAACTGQILPAPEICDNVDNNCNSMIDEGNVCVAPTMCDVDIDGDIDQNDLSLISKARGQTALPGDLRDADGNGLITPNDVKVCIPQCTRPNCAVQ